MKEMPALTEDYCPNLATNHLSSSPQPFPASKPSKFKSMFLSIIFGQLLSAILSGTNIFVVLLNQTDIYPAVFPNSMVYHMILLFSLFRFSKTFSFYKSHLGSPWLFVNYILMGVIDFTANVAVLKAFENTSSLSVLVITSSSVIFVMILSIFLFKRKYLLLHGIGSAVVIMGLILINYSKYLEGLVDGGNFKWTGTLLAFLAAICYALSNVLQEKVTKVEKGYPFATLAMMGLIGSVVSGITTHATEFGQQDRDMLLFHPSMSKYFVIGYICCMVCFYIFVPWYMQHFTAIKLNFNLLTADLWVGIFNVLFKKSTFDEFYWIGFFSVLSGLVLFNIKNPIEFSESDVAVEEERHYPADDLERF